MAGYQYKNGDFDMDALVKNAQKQRESRQIKKQTTQSQQKLSNDHITVASDIDSAHDGEYVADELGGAIVLDSEEQLRKIQENDKTSKSLMALINSPDLISDINGYNPDYGEDAPEGYDPGVQFITENPYDPKTKEIKKIKEGFSGLTFGINGLVDANSEEGRLVAEALEKVRSGEVVLPTPEEYEEQKRQREERKRQRREQLSGKSEPENKPNQKNQNTVETVSRRRDIRNPERSDLHMAEMPENVIVKKGAVEQMAENMNEQNVTTNVSTRRPVVAVEEEPKKTESNVVRAIHAQPEPEPVPLDPVEIPEDDSEGGLIIDTPKKKNTEPVENAGEVTPQQTEEPEYREEPQQQQRAHQPINLADMEEAYEEAKEAPVMTPEEEAEEKQTITEFNVPAEEAGTFLKSMPLEAYDKVVQSKSIKVNKVELRSVPVASRRVESIADYRALKQRRSANKPTEVAERVLINSGFIITLKPATSMEMSVIFKSMVDNETDWRKTYEFCYEHTISTTIGKLSFDQFIADVSPADLETILHGIYEVSEPGNRKIQVMCGLGDGGCGAPYEVTIDTSTLPSIDKLPERSKERIKEIIEVRHDIQKAKELQLNSPTVDVKVVKLDDRYLYIRTTTGHMIIERTDRLAEIQENYGPFIALLIMYVEKITIEYSVREDSEPEVIDLTDVDIICEELKSLSDDDLDNIKTLIADELNDYEPVRYSLKGQFTCPNCGLTKTEIGCQISDLIFQKVQRMLG